MSRHSSCHSRQELTEGETLFFQEKEVNGIKFWCYHAGHVLGAAMFMIEIAGVKVIWLIIFNSGYALIVLYLSCF